MTMRHFNRFRNIKRKSNMTGRGGVREGAGRPVGSQNRATVDMKSRLSLLAREYTYIAFEALVEIAENGKSETARIAAATALLDRGFGKPREAGFDQYSEPSMFDLDF
jgi:hypothetical protein